MKKIFIVVLFLVTLTGCKQGRTELEQAQTKSPNDEKFISQALGIEFQRPVSDSDCREKEIDITKSDSSITGYTPQGRYVKIRCSGIFILAVSKDFKPYEGYWPYGTHPSFNQMMESCPGDGICKFYKTSDENKNVDILVMDTYWGADPGGTYWIGTYVPIANNPYYETVRFSMQFGKLPDYRVENRLHIVEEYLQNVKDKNLDVRVKKKIEDFEKMIFSIKLR